MPPSPTTMPFGDTLFAEPIADVPLGGLPAREQSLAEGLRMLGRFPRGAARRAPKATLALCRFSSAAAREVHKVKRLLPSVRGVQIAHADLPSSTVRALRCLRRAASTILAEL